MLRRLRDRLRRWLGIYACPLKAEVVDSFGGQSRRFDALEAQVVALQEQVVALKAGMASQPPPIPKATARKIEPWMKDVDWERAGLRQEDFL